MKAILAKLAHIVESANVRPTRSQALRFGISFALAVLIWGWVTDLQDPFRAREIANVPVEIGDLPDTLQIVSTLPDAMVTLRGAESRVQAVDGPALTVEADTAGITEPGTYLVSLELEVDDVSDHSVEPREVTIQVDAKVSEIFTLTVSFIDTMDQSRAIGSVVPVVSQVTVTGPTSAVDRIVEVILPVTIEQQSQSYDEAYVPYAVDGSGQRVTEVDILPASVMTYVEVQTRGKAVSVIPAISGVPAEGYSVQQRRALPDTIVVDGPLEILNDLLFVNTEPVDVTDSTQSISTRVGLADLPEGVAILEPASGSVEVRVAIEDTTASSQTLSNLPVASIGLEDGLTASVDPESVSLQVSAPLDILQAMTSEDIGIFVNVTGLGPGTYRLVPEVTVPQGATWLGGDAAEILVTIEESLEFSPEAATPGASPVP
ncbi:MAG: CdaR family protein [Thermomicrobiales bacterium]